MTGADVVQHRGVKQVRILKDHCDEVAASLGRQGGEIRAIDEDLPGGGLVSPASRKSSVDLPEPDGPTIAVVVPGSKASVRLATTCRCGAAS